MSGQWAINLLNSIEAACLCLTKQDHESSNQPARQWSENAGQNSIFFVFVLVVQGDCKGRAGIMVTCCCCAGVSTTKIWRMKRSMLLC